MFYLMSEKLLICKKYIRDALFFKAEDPLKNLEGIFRIYQICTSQHNLYTPNYSPHDALYFQRVILSVGFDLLTTDPFSVNTQYILI